MHCVCTYDVRCQGNAKARSRGASRPGTLDSCARTYGRAQAPWACAIDTDSEADKSESSERRSFDPTACAIDTDSETDGSESSGSCAFGVHHRHGLRDRRVRELRELCLRGGRLTSTRDEWPSRMHFI